MYFELKRVTNETPCRRCGEVMHSGEWLCRSWIYIDPSTEETKAIYYHPACAVDVDAKNAALAFAPARLSFESEWRTATPHEREALAPIEALANKRAAAIERLAEDRKKIAHGEKVAPWTIEPATDRKGRPRVRVRFGGNASSGAYTPVFERCVPDWTVCSAKREYVLAPAAASIQNSSDDPSQPVVAALFGTRANVKIVGSQRDKVRAWRAEGLPTPIVWLVGSDPKDKKGTDKKVLELREMLASAGYEADDAIALTTEHIDEAAFAAVASALDELLDRGAKVEDLSQTTVVERAISLLETAIDDGRTEAWKTALERASAMLDAASAAERARIAELAAKCARAVDAQDEVAKIIVSVKTATRATHAAAATIVASLLSEKRRKIGDGFDALCATLERPISDERARVDLGWLAMIEDAVTAESGVTKRGELFVSILVRAGDAACAERLAAKAATVKASAKREWLEQSARKIAAKNAKTASSDGADRNKKR
jgi:hypothetical protein